MYEFIDSTSVSGADNLPSEAVMINGEYIENQIEGYRTLYVAGREALSPETDSYETGIRDGSVLQKRRYPARTITVTYQVIAKTNEAYRDAYNELGRILDQARDAQLIFHDEQDKYYIGTVSRIGEIDPGKNAVTGEFDFYCADPFKYSVAEYSILPNEDNILQVDYKGTYKAYPTLQATFYQEEDSDGETDKTLTGNGDCGYVAFYNDDSKIIQLGDPEELDGVVLAKSQTLTNQKFQTSGAFGTSAKKNWSVNSGVVTSSDFTQTGSAGIKVSGTYNNGKSNYYYLGASSYGSGSKWHGPSITRKIPADGAGETGAKNFTLTYSQKISIGTAKADTKQVGAFFCLLTDASNKIIAGVTVYKASAGRKGKIKFWVNGKTQSTKEIDLSYRNKYFGSNTTDKKGKVTKKTVKTTSITKSGSKITFNVGGIKKTYSSASIEESKVVKVTFMFSQYGTKPALNKNGLYWCKFVKHNCNTWREIKNKFTADDEVSADCRTGKIELNGSPAPELGALGNDWEGFYLTPGINMIGTSYSDWVEAAYAPKFGLTYREVYL